MGDELVKQQDILAMAYMLRAHWKPLGGGEEHAIFENLLRNFQVGSNAAFSKHTTNIWSRMMKLKETGT